MSDANKTYTYRCGEKVELEKSTDEIVVRALPATLDDATIVGTEQVSSASTKIKVSDTELEGLMNRSRTSAPTHHAYYETESGSEFLITDRIFVTFEDPLTDAQVDEFAGRYGLLKKTTYSDREYLFQLTNHTGMNPVKLVVTLIEKEQLVELAEHDLNQRMQKYQFSVPVDPDYARQWHLHTNFNDIDYDPRSCSMSENAWRLLDDFGSDDVVIAVTDDGCKLDHFDFDSPNKFASWGYLRGERLITAVDIDADPDQMYKAGANHGTSCCGVIGGEVDAVLTAGASAGCQLLPIQWESSGPSLFISDSKLVTTLNYLSDKADVMSNSWGGVPISMWALNVVNRIRELALTGGRRGNGIVFLWAAGNENCLINSTVNQDVPYTGGVEVQGGSLVWMGVETTRVFRNNLVGIPGLIHIAALASTAQRSHYSNYGPGMSLCAPTSNSHSYHRMTVRGLGITTTTGPSPAGVTDSFGGTSSATPLVAGVAGLVISANPNVTALEVISILQQTASKDLDFANYPKTPPASFDSDTSWDVSPIAPFDDGHFVDNGDVDGTWSPWFGHGRVDAQAAVAEAMNRLKTAANSSFNGDSAPDRSIPDNNDRGIKDKILCDENFALSSIKVGVEITHTYIGDLQVSLVSPSGTSVILHNRSGAGQNDLVATFDANSTPDLHTFTGEIVNGDWLLQVRDLASVDRGRLKSWSLELAGSDQPSISLEESPGVTIPDNTVGGIERILSVPDNGQLDTIEIELDITHTYIGDLVIRLISPSGTAVVLHNQSGGSADNLIRAYGVTNTSALQVLRGESISGDWRLNVSDHANADQGKLNRWAIKLGLV
jgi:subtilisin-like proprotein convertase family protein/subtilisin family serine protease